MAVARRKELPEAAMPMASRPKLRGVEVGETYADSHNPIAEQLIKLEGALTASAADQLPRYSGKVRLAIHDGDLLTGSLTAPGFASAVHPDWTTMAPLSRPKPRILQEQT